MGVRINTRFLRSVTTEKESGERHYDSELSGFGVLVRRTGKKVFFVRYGGRRFRRTVYLGEFGTLTADQARIAARETLAKAALGGDPAAERRRRKTEILFHEWVKKYLERVAPSRKNDKLLAQDRFYLEKVGCSFWKNRALSSIATEDVAEARQRVATDHSPVMGNRFMSYVSACLGTAERAGLIAKNPVAAVEPRRLEEPPPRERILSAPEIRRLYASLENEDDTTRTAFRLLIETGARLSEILGAAWTDFDEHTGTIRLASPKAGKPQLLVVPKPLAAHLATRKQKATSPWIVPARTDATKPRSDLKPEWEGVKTRSALSDVRLHDLRRTLGSDLARRFGILAASRALRHSSIEITRRHYVPDDLGEQRKALESRARLMLKGETKERGTR